jgi:Protein of unknown function (DUF1326)
MRTAAFLLAGFACFLGRSLPAQDPPRGELLELHSCEVYAGPCLVSSQATLEGRYMVRAWDFSGGSFQRTPFAGLKVAVLETAPENLAAPDTAAARAVVYLPANATAAQRQALLAWVKATQIHSAGARIQTRAAPLEFAKTARGYRFSAGPYLSVSTAPLECCNNGMCGEGLWYQPRSPSTEFTVAVDHASRVVEPLLKLIWTEAGKRSVFLARFGPSSPAAAGPVYVSTADLCGPRAQGTFF